MKTSTTPKDRNSRRKFRDLLDVAAGRKPPPADPTKGQKKQILRLVEDSLDKVYLDRASLQRVIQRGDELQREVMGSICRFGAHHLILPRLWR